MSTQKYTWLCMKVFIWWLPGSNLLHSEFTSGNSWCQYTSELLFTDIGSPGLTVLILLTSPKVFACVFDEGLFIPWKYVVRKNMYQWKLVYVNWWPCEFLKE